MPTEAISPADRIQMLEERVGSRSVLPTDPPELRAARPLLP